MLQVDSLELKTDPAYESESQEVKKRIKLLEYRMIPEPKIRALWDRGAPSPTYILRRGMPTSFGDEVQPGPPAVLTSATLKYEVAPPWPGSEKTGRRLAFAKWLTNPEHPLTSRVMVNRIWKHHFGNGIVRSVGNFGKTGTAPSNPELLDWLATEFIKQGWSIKQMQRLMMTSSVYRQASIVSDEAERIDPDDILLSHMPLRRMEAEVLNDTLLLVSGRLDETRYGVAEPVLERGDGLVTPIETGKGWRRSIYIEQRRTQIPTLLDNFDLPPMSPNCVERQESTVSLQALYLMNNTMVRRLADSLADRIVREVGHDPHTADRIRFYWMAVSRPPTAEEAKASLEDPGMKTPSKSRPGMNSSTQSHGHSGRVARAGQALPLRFSSSAAFIYID